MSRTASDVGFLLAKASQRFNQRLGARLAEGGFPDVRPSYGSVLVPLFDGGPLRIGEVAAVARLSKQSMTGLVRQCEEAGLVGHSRRSPSRRWTSSTASSWPSSAAGGATR